jgi:glycosyltransferase involved in cell wall biosynthesis
MASAGERRRVLIVVQNLPVPFDRRVWLEATTLARSGFTVSVICPKGTGFRASREVLEGIHIYRYSIPFEAKGALGFAAEFVWCFVRTLFLSVRVSARGPGFDILHACNPPDTYWLLAVLWRPFGKTFVFDHHDLAPEMYRAKFGDRAKPWTEWALLRLERATFRWSDRVITTNESHRKIALERGRVPEERVFVVRSGPDPGRFDRYPPDASLKKGRSFLLVYLGEMCEQDGVDYLVRAIRILRDEMRADFHCCFVGGGPHQPSLRAYAETLGVGDLCTFTGRVSDQKLCRILSSADLAIDPVPRTEWSDKSTMNKIVEYMYFGLPIVCFDLAESRESAGPAAVYARPNEERDLALTVHRLLDDPCRRAEMSRLAEKRLHERLSWEHSVPRLREAYADL